MSDQSQPPPPSPPVFQFPVQLLEQWITIPPHEHIAVSLTKQDIDNLVLGLLRNADAVSALERILVSWSNGKVDEANKELATFRNYNADSQNFIRQFATALMFSILQGRQKNAP